MINISKVLSNIISEGLYHVYISPDERQILQKLLKITNKEIFTPNELDDMELVNVR